MRVILATVAVFLGSAISLAWLLVQIPSELRSPTLVGSFVAFVVASIGLFFRPRIGYALGMLSGLVALHWFWRIEFAYFPAVNCWIAFNLPSSTPYFVADVYLAKLKILFAVLVVTAISCSIIRFLPANWILRKIPLRDRTWPAAAICILVIAAWYVVSASPYRIPLIVDGVAPEMSLLHVEKRGRQFHETAVTAYHDRRLYVNRNDRKYFQYRFATRRSSGILPGEIASHLQALAQSRQLVDMHTPPAIALRDKNAEGWYVRIGDAKVLAFTTEYGTKPPRDLVDLFRDLQALSLDQKETETTSDVCMGFCYDPLAGLGIVNMNQRCTERNGTRCR
jgi:hypothetical protein